MYLTSTLNPLSKSQDSIAVAIFSLGDQHKFLRVSEDYQDTLRQIIKSFNLDADVCLSLRTSTIDVCRGKEVEIDESAYLLMCKFVDEFVVSVVERAQTGRRQQKQAQGKGRAITLISPEPSFTSLNHDLEMEDLPASSTVIHSEVPLIEGRSHTPIPEDIGKGITGGSSSEVADTAGGRVEHSQKSRKHVDDERSEDEDYQVSQEKGKTADVRPIPEPEGNGEGGSNLRKKFRPAGALFLKSNKDIGSPATIRKEILVEPSNEVLSEAPPKYPETNPPATQSEEDPRFEITIIGPQHESAQFKTRGKHPVRKVLAAACKTFGVKYERARLILSVSIEEGGKIYTNEFDCPAEETMSRCGVDGNARLFVRVNADQDREEYEEE